MFYWENLPKIDAHIHLTPIDVILANSNCIDDPFVTHGKLDDYLVLMDKYNIEQSFIMPFNDPYMLSMDFTVESVNKNMLKMISNASSKFKLFVDIDIRKSVNYTIEEIDKFLKEEEFVGIKIHSSNSGCPLDGEYYNPIFDYASANNTLVELHSYPREHITDDVCSPSRIRTVLKKYPNLKISVAHLGGFQYEDLIDLNTYCNISAILPDFVKRFGVKKANSILRKFNTEKLIFATDYPDSRSLKPDNIYKEYFAILNEMDFNLEEAKKICKGNILKAIRETLIKD